MEEVIQIAHRYLDVATHRNLSAFWAEVPHLIHQGKYWRAERDEQIKQQLDAILSHTLRDIKAFGYRDLAQTTLGIAKIVQNIDAGRRITKGSPRHILHNIFIGNNSQKKEYIFGCMAEASRPILAEFRARELSNLIYAFGLVEYAHRFEDGRRLFDILAAQAIFNLKDSRPQEMSNILFAYANVGARNHKLFKEAGDRIVAHKDFSADISNDFSTVPYANLKEFRQKLFAQVADNIAARDDNEEAFKPQTMSNTVWAYATLDISHTSLFKKIADHIVGLDNLKAFAPQALSNLVWAYATAKESHPKLFKKVSNHIVALDDLRAFAPQNLSNLVWAHATAKEVSPLLSQKIAEAAIKRQNEFSSQELANLLYAFATNGQTDQNLFESLVPTVAAHIGKCDEQGLANLAWAYAVANVAAPLLFDDDFITACIVKENDFTSEGLRQLYQWNLWQEELKSNVRLPPILQEKCKKAFVDNLVTTSAFQSDVISELISIGLQPEEEVLMESGYRLDAVVEVNGKRIGIEVDGPTHFVGREPTGSTILKHRQVTNLDEVEVISVPYWEWEIPGKGYGNKQ